MVVVVVLIEFDVDVVDFIGAHLPEEYCQHEESDEGEDGHTREREDVGAHCVDAQLVSLLECVEGHQG